MPLRVARQVRGRPGGVECQGAGTRQHKAPRRMPQRIGDGCVQVTPQHRVLRGDRGGKAGVQDHRHPGSLDRLDGRQQPVLAKSLMAEQLIQRPVAAGRCTRKRPAVQVLIPGAEIDRGEIIPPVHLLAVPGQKDQHQIIRQCLFRDRVQGREDLVRRRVRVGEQDHVRIVIDRRRRGFHQLGHRTGIADGIGQIELAALEGTDPHAQHMQRDLGPHHRLADRNGTARMRRLGGAGGGRDPKHTDLLALGRARLDLSRRAHRRDANDVEAFPERDRRLLDPHPRRFLADKERWRDNRVVAPDHRMAQFAVALLQPVVHQQHVAGGPHRAAIGGGRVQGADRRAAARQAAGFMPTAVQYRYRGRQATGQDGGDVAQPLPLIGHRLARLGRVAQGQADQIRAEEHRIKLADFHEDAGTPVLRVAPVADQRAAIRLAIAALVVREKPLRRPHHPAPGGRIDEQRHQFLAAAGAVPDHGTVPEPGDDLAAIGADVHRPDRRRGHGPPCLPPLDVEAHIEIRPERRRRTGMGYRRRPGCLRRLQLHRHAVDLRRRRVLPVGNRRPAITGQRRRQSRGRSRGRPAGSGRARDGRAQFARPCIEHHRRAGWAGR